MSRRERTSFRAVLAPARTPDIVRPLMPSPAEASEAARPDATDLYTLTGDAVEPPPPTLRLALRRIGPGMVLAASIVGSGELIATTTLGARVGYMALWIILGSCAIKPVVQGELGRYTIATGETGLEAFNRVPGPRLRVNWLIACWALTVLLSLLQVGGMFGGVAQVLHLAVPAISVNLWVGLCLALTLALLLGGAYARIERFAILKVSFFTVLTICAALVLFLRPDALTWDDLADGLSLQLPDAGLAIAVAVFGITGVGATELVMYPYWCIEKGYARYTGPRDGSPEWLSRARGWIRVMHLDITCSLAIYTVATVAFYLLGAGILHPMGLVPAATDMITVLSRLYTDTLGGWAIWLFYAGAIITLYGTIFASTAAHSRLCADLLRIGGLYRRDDGRRRTWWRDAFVVLLATLPAIFFWTFKSPVQMVVAGGLAQALMLPLIGLAAVYLRHRHLPADLAPSAATTIALWASTLVMLAVAIYYTTTLI
jgi:Mn2+/Fe2+ NRAMP family transporter